ncbi:hypothetical protein AB3N59_12310 [Leptospira sp. WS92.C1]
MSEIEKKSSHIPRKFNSEIYVDSKDRWIFRGNRIVQKEVLTYFRKNLREDDLGIFIDNHFGEFSENGYLELDGYPIHLTSCKEDGDTLFFLSETEESFSINDLIFATDADGCLFARTSITKRLKFRPDRNCLSDLSAYLEEEQGKMEIRFQNRVIPIPSSQETPKVTLPTELKEVISQKNQ